MLAGIALLLCTSVLVKMKRERYVWVTLVPTAWLLITTLTAGVQKIFDPDPRIGFLALAHKFSDAAAKGTVLAPAKSIEEMQRVAFNNYLDAVVCGFFVLLVVAMCVFAVKICLQRAEAGDRPRTRFRRSRASKERWRESDRHEAPSNGFVGHRRRAGVRENAPDGLARSYADDFSRVTSGVRNSGLRAVSRAHGGASFGRPRSDAPRLLRSLDRPQVQSQRTEVLLGGVAAS